MDEGGSILAHTDTEPFSTANADDTKTQTGRDIRRNPSRPPEKSERSELAMRLTGPDSE